MKFQMELLFFILKKKKSYEYPQIYLIKYTSHVTYFRAELTLLWPSEFYTTVNTDYN